jgi:hypothetical protein
MKRVFVCSPYANDIPGNTDRAIKYCLAEVNAGNVPFAPHLIYPQILSESDPEGRKKGIELGLAMMEACDELHIYGDRVSNGMATEIAHWNKLRVMKDSFIPYPMFYNIEAYTSWFDNNPAAESGVLIEDGEIKMSGVRNGVRSPSCS